MNTLFDLSLRGSLVFLIVWTMDRLWSSRMKASGRRWWWGGVAFAFVVSIPIPILPAEDKTPVLAQWTATPWAMLVSTSGLTAVAVPAVAWETFLKWVWGAGVVAFLVGVVVQTRRVVRYWSHERLSTDPVLLELLEDCKQEAGVTAPIGLVVSSHIAAPAILGWLRPRILLPAGLASSLSSTQLRAVFWHELAHFRSWDIPLNWVFTLARALHWFNPLTHVAGMAWERFREEAADETAMGWMKEVTGDSYGTALIQTLRQANGASAPLGAMAIGESIHHLKRRITMIHYYPHKTPHAWLAGTVALLLAAMTIVQPIRADDNTASPEKAAASAMDAWLKEIDASQYEQSWKDASISFQQALTVEKWTAALTGVRKPLGKCNGRKVASLVHQTEIPQPNGELQKSDMVIAQFDTSFDNLQYAVETVTFVKEANGSWKAAGYYIKPKT